MNKKLAALAIGTLTVGSALVINVEGANACWLCKRRDEVTGAGKRLERGIRRPVEDRLQAKFKICNQTQGWKSIVYRKIENPYL